MWVECHIQIFRKKKKKKKKKKNVLEFGIRRWRFYTPKAGDIITFNWDQDSHQTMVLQIIKIVERFK